MGRCDLASERGLRARRRGNICRRCAERLRPGEGYYQFDGIVLCDGCLPEMAPALLLAFRSVTGEENWR